MENRIFKNADIAGQVKELIAYQPGLSVIQNCSKCIKISGKVTINKSACGYHLCSTYEVLIEIPLDKTEFPKVYETSGLINSEYCHRYLTGELCLETNIVLWNRFANGFNLLRWFIDMVESYFFTYEYYSRYEFYPFGERSHDELGIIESYKDLLHEEDTTKLISLLEFIAFKEYRGHLKCPCESGYSLRKCHGPFLLPFFENKELRNQALNDFILIMKSIEESYDKRERN